MSLCANKVSYLVDGCRLIEHFDLSVETGEILMLAGNNGAGKSTLLSLLAGCPQPSAGEVTLESRPLVAWPVSELAMRRAILPQSPSLGFDFSAAEVVELGAAVHAVRAAELKRRTREVMQWMDVAHLADRGFFSLSGGECRRVQLARVLLQICLVPSLPRYLLLDEPFAALDFAHQYALMERLRSLVVSKRGGGVGVVLVTHDLNIALRYADRVCLLKAGCCHAAGAAGEVITPANIRAVFGVDAVVTGNSVATQPIATSG